MMSPTYKTQREQIQNHQTNVKFYQIKYWEDIGKSWVQIRLFSTELGVTPEWPKTSSYC